MYHYDDSASAKVLPQEVATSREEEERGGVRCDWQGSERRRAPVPLSLSVFTGGLSLCLLLLKCSKVTLFVQKKESRPAGPEHDFISSLPLSALTPPV